MLSVKHAINYAVVVSCLFAGLAWGQGDYRFIGDDADVVRFHLGAQVPSYLSQDSVRAAAEAALVAWNGGGSRLQFDTALRVSHHRHTDDLQSVLPLFVTNPADSLYGRLNENTHSIVVPQAAGMPSALGHVLTSCDIVLNAVDFRWSTAPETDAEHMDLQSVLMHAIGLCLGLPTTNDWTDEHAVMNAPLLRGAWRRALRPFDSLALQERYPLGGPGARCGAGIASLCDSGAQCLPQRVHNPLNPQNYCTPPCDAGVGAACHAPLYCTETEPVVFPGQWTCLLPDLTPAPIVGTACSAQNSCTSRSPVASAECFLGAMWPGGYCSQPCNTESTDNWGECPANSRCVMLDRAVCLHTCKLRGNDCRPGYACHPVDNSDSEGVCQRHCQSDADCALGFACNPLTGLCSVQQYGGPIGTACDSNSQCATGQECWTLSTTWTHATCTARCRPGESTCPAGSACMRIGEGEGAELLCLKRCETRGACLDGMQCTRAATGHGGEEKVCLPPCTTLADCPPGSTQCTQGQCQAPGDAGSALQGGSELEGIKPDTPSPSTKKSSGCNATGPTPWLLWALALWCIRPRPPAVL